jgi:hypothetical protein
MQVICLWNNFKLNRKFFTNKKKQLKLFAMKLCPIDIKIQYTNSASKMPDSQYVKIDSVTDLIQNTPREVIYPVLSKIFSR